MLHDPTFEPGGPHPAPLRRGGGLPRSIGYERIRVHPKLKFIGFFGIEYGNCINGAVATKQGVTVSYTPPCAATVFAECPLGPMFGLPRHIAVFSDSLERDERLPAKFQGVDLKGKFVGVVDLEPIGADVARLGAGMGVNVLGLAWTETPGRAQHGLRLLSLDALFAGADVGTLHLTLNHHTERFIFRPL